MAYYKKGILGAFSGKVGPVVGATWRGKDVLRSLPKRSNRNPTELQIMQREKFTFVTNFISKFQPIIGRYYGSDSGTKTRRNQAFAYLINEAIDESATTLAFDYSKIALTKGYLLGVDHGVLSTTVTGVLGIQWTENSDQGEAMDTDKLIVGVYEPESKRSYISLNAANRAATTAELYLPTEFSGKTVHVWAAFASENDKRFASSSYLGAVLII